MLFSCSCCYLPHRQTLTWNQPTWKWLKFFKYNIGVIAIYFLILINTWNHVQHPRPSVYWGPGSHPGNVYYSNHVGSSHGSLTGSTEERSSNNKKQCFVLILTTFLKNSKQYNNDQGKHKCKKQILILTTCEWMQTLDEFTNINRSLL